MKSFVAIVIAVLINQEAFAQGWERQIPPTELPLNAVAFVDTSNGWAVGGQAWSVDYWYPDSSRSIILHTTNGGETWTIQSSDTGYFLTEVEFVDVDHGWAVGSVIGSDSISVFRRSVIMRTTNGGAIWTTQVSDSSRCLSSVDFVDLNHGWAVGSVDCWTPPSDILHTTDGGLTWVTQASVSHLMHGVHFLDVNHGWTVGGFCDTGSLDDGEVVYCTTDGGATWTPQVAYCSYPFRRVEFIDANHGWIVGGCMPEGYDMGGFWRTTDGGATWSTHGIPGVRQSQTVFDFIDANWGWAAGNGALSAWAPPFYVIQHTTDGGVSWWTQETGAPLTRVQDIDFADANHGWIVGSAGRYDSNGVLDSTWSLILHTSNGGRSGGTAPDTVWTRTLGGAGNDYGYSIQETADGGYIVAGLTESLGAGSGDFYLVKTNGLGDMLWARAYGGSGWDEARSVQPTTDGGYIVAGTTTSFGAGSRDFYLVKTDSQGDTIWTRTFGGANDEWAFSVQQVADGDYIVAGITSSFGAGQRDIYLVKADERGDTLWTRTIGGEGNDEGWGIQQLSDGGYVIAGTTRSYGAGNWDYYLVRTDADGFVVWSQTYGGEAGDGGRSVQQTSDGGFIFGGWSCSFSGYYDAYLVRTDVHGYAEWNRADGGSDWDECQSVVQTADRGFLSLGFTRSFGAGDWDVYLVRTDSLGNSVWSTGWGGSAADRGWSLARCSDGGHVIAGETSSFGAGGSDVYLIRLADEQVEAVHEEHEPLPTELMLRQNYPNPFNSTTNIAYDLPKAGRISLRVFDLLGREVAVLKDGIVEAGGHRTVFDGSGLASGIYFARLEAGEFSQTRKLMLLK
ncbi:T9SS type A sorting domain-containing protein [candidate division KSB1 bacterium]|nr:T9SS type A sorting domain-containing protein [candidate division KSB1 bacterium]